MDNNNPSLKELLAPPWTDPDRLMQAWARIHFHPRICARELGISVKEAKRIKNRAANFATYLRLKAEGNPQAQKYLDIYHKI
jgi:hypothetical protein